MMKVTTLIGILHIIEMIIMSTYIIWRIFLPSNIVFFLDFCFIYIIYLLFLSWLVFEDECIISLIYKRMHPDHKSTKLDTLDLIELLGKYDRVVAYIFFTLIIVTLYLIANQRNVPYYLVSIFTVVFVFYNVSLRKINKDGYLYLTTRFFYMFIVAYVMCATTYYYFNCQTPMAK